MNKPLIQTNPHLQNKASLQRQILAHVASSTAIETGRSYKTELRDLMKDNSSSRKPTRTNGKA